MISSNIEKITPEMAARYLESNRVNRSFRHVRAETLARAMTRGEWALNGDAIRFYENGDLADGQHRLSAIVETGVTIESFVIRGLKSDTSATIDKGAPRTTADNLVIDLGVQKNVARHVAAAAAHVIAHDTGLQSWARSGSQTHKYTTSLAVEEWYTENIDVIDRGVCFITSELSRASYFIPRSGVLALSILFDRSNPELSHDFLARVLNGHEISKDSPEDYLRSAMLRADAAKRKLPTAYRLYSVAKVFKSRVAGREIKHAGNICYRPGADSIPVFPGFGTRPK